MMTRYNLITQSAACWRCGLCTSVPLRKALKPDVDVVLCARLVDSLIVWARSAHSHRAVVTAFSRREHHNKVSRQHSLACHTPHPSVK
jgi:hypothetical protein